MNAKLRLAILLGLLLCIPLLIFAEIAAAVAFSTLLGLGPVVIVVAIPIALQVFALVALLTIPITKAWEDIKNDCDDGKFFPSREDEDIVEQGKNIRVISQVQEENKDPHSGASYGRIFHPPAAFEQEKTQKELTPDHSGTCSSYG